MNLLLDTHTFLWWDSGRLPRAVVRRIQLAGEVFLSAASAWEIAIKAALGKLEQRGEVADALDDYGFRELPVTVAHAASVRTLAPHHRDPFDRMLVAQALVEGLVIVSRDPVLSRYEARVVWG